MTAGKEELEPCVRVVRSLVLRLRGAGLLKGGEDLQLLSLPGQSCIAAEAVDGLPPAYAVEPGGGIRWDAGRGPSLEGGDAGILQGVLGQGEVARVGDERGQDAPGFLTEDLVNYPRDLLDHSPPRLLRRAPQAGEPDRSRRA